MDSTRAISMELQISFTFLWMGSSSLDFPRSDVFVIKWTPRPPSVGWEGGCVIFFLFPLQRTGIFASTTKIPKILILLSLSDLTFASGREGIDNPFIALVARFLFVCVGTEGNMP